MYCNFCGKVIQDDAAVCAYCGKRVAAVATRKRLMRPRKGRQIAGVCAGLAEFFDLDVALIRIITLVTAIFGWGVIAYAVAWIAMPEEPLALPSPVTSPVITSDKVAHF
jgi:phage shock protein C